MDAWTLWTLWTLGRFGRLDAGDAWRLGTLGGGDASVLRDSVDQFEGRRIR